MKPKKSAAKLRVVPNPLPTIKPEAKPKAKAKAKGKEIPVFDIANLGDKSKQPLLSPAVSGYFSECARVVLHRAGRPEIGKVKIQGSPKFRKAVLIYSEPDTAARRSNADIQEATEQGAYALALLVLKEHDGSVMVERAAKGPGFDFWVSTHASWNFTGRLEVSGILVGTPAMIRARVAQKRSQTGASRSSGLVAYVVVVEFSTPTIQLTVVR